MGEVASMGAVILQAADNRISTPNTEIMLHDGEATFSGHVRDFEKYAEQLKKDRYKTYKIFSDRSGKKRAYYNRKCCFDWRLTPEEAIEEGLLDSVCTNIFKP